MTLFQFDATVPATNDNPSADQPDMLVNNQSTNGILGVDHITFNLNNGGQHKAITFNQDASYVPASFPVNPPQLFTNTTDGAGNALPNGVPELFFYSGSSAQSQTQYVSKAQGSVLLFGGIILKWGTVTLPNTGASQTVTYPVAFPNGCFAVNAIKSDTVSSANLLLVTNFSGVPNTFQAVKSSASSSLQITYIAIGN